MSVMASLFQGLGKSNNMRNKTMNEKKDIASFTLGELEQELASLGEKKFRSRQVYDWIHKKHITDFEQMSNLSKDLREKLNKEYALYMPKILKVLESKLDGTRKYLFELYDGNIIESVLMRYKHGNSVCVSSQAGCRMGCKFCASTLNGLERNLYPSEILGQIYVISADINERISNVVVMGSGEPLDNFDNIVRFITLLTDENGLNISQRNLTISTCGLVDKIYKMADMGFNFTLAISLHSPTDELRKSIMPVANAYSIDEIIKACEYYYHKNNRRITFEYTIIKDFNDSKECAYILSDLMNRLKKSGVITHINLISVNPVKETNFQKTDTGFIMKFKNILETNKNNVTIRREMGSDINAACGQLRKSYIDAGTKRKVQ